MSGDICNDGRNKIIEQIEKDLLESTNTTEEFAYSFALRCWQLNYRKERHGKWGERNGYGCCSACGQVFEEQIGYYSYCPNCGALMDGEQE